MIESNLDFELTLLAFSSIAAFLFRLLFSACAASDTRGFLWRFNRLKDKFSFHYDLDDCVIPAKHGYPILFPLILSKLPERLWLYVGYTLNSLVDIAIALIIFVILKQLKLDNVFEYLPLITSVLYLATPALTPVTARMMAFNGRAIGALLYLMYFGFALFIIEYQINYYIPFCMVMLILIVLTSQFAFQAVIFSTIGLSLIYLLNDGNAVAFSVLIIMPIIALLIGYFVPKLGVKDVLNYFVGLYFWQFKNRKTGTMPAARSKWLSTFWRQIRLGAFNRAVKTMFRLSPQVLIILHAPALIFTIVLLYKDIELINSLMSIPVGRYSIYLTISLYLTSLLTSYGVGLIFGQAERYIEYVAPYISFVAVFCTLASEIDNESKALLIVLLFAINIAFSLLNLVNALSIFGYLFGGKNDSLSGERCSFVTWLDKLPDNTNVLTVPLIEGKKLSIQNKLFGLKKIKTLYDWISPEGQFPLDYMVRYFRGIQYYPEGFKSIVLDMKIDAILITKSKAVMWMQDHHETDWVLFSDNLPRDWEVVFEDNDFVLIVSNRILKKIETA